MCTYIAEKIEIEGNGKGTGGWFELRQGHTPIARSSVEKDMDMCEKIHREMIRQHSEPSQRAAELSNAVEIYSPLRELEAGIAVSLEKLRLKRSFPGRCEICPE